MVTPLDFFNIVMAIGIAALAYANYRLGKDNQILREKNRRERLRESRQQPCQ